MKTNMNQIVTTYSFTALQVWTNQVEPLLVRFFVN
jgi:hypothetical protein